LIESLLKPNGPLTVHPASYEELVRMRGVYLRDHPYPMTDHGLFVAGIIHTIAPAAQIHLYEVLNPDGVGDLKTIADGLRKVLDDFQGRPLVINCSLVLNLPPLYPSDTESFRAKMDDILRGWDEVEKDPVAWAEHQALSINWICDWLYLSGARVIAAAGNDRTGKPRPQADYPAAFDSVVGVGALSKGNPPRGPFNPAKYSNLADRPAKIGITTLGGEQGENNGVLGIYLGEFPGEQRMESQRDGKDWAWWAGTSFAAPIITAVTAAVLSTCTPATTEEAIRKLYESQAFITQDWEDVLAVEQG
jgi:subtilisin family serine protease